MKGTHIKIILIEALILVLLSSIAGIGFNWKLLSSAWKGESLVSTPPSAVQGAIPLPLGLVQVKELLDSNEAVIIDSRDSKTFAAGHITGATSIPLSEAPALLPALSGRIKKDKMIIVYCNGYSCEDSVELGKQLISAGYLSVYYFDGGFPAWRDAKYPVSGGAK